MGEKRDRKVLGKEGSGRHGARVVRVLGVWDGRGFGVDDCELSDLLRKRMEVDWGWSEFGTRVRGTELLPWEEQRSCRLWEWALAESSEHYKELWPCSMSVPRMLAWEQEGGTLMVLSIPVPILLSLTWSEPLLGQAPVFRLGLCHLNVQAFSHI